MVGPLRMKNTNGLFAVNSGWRIGNEKLSIFKTEKKLLKFYDNVAEVWCIQGGGDPKLLLILSYLQPQLQQFQSHRF